MLSINTVAIHPPMSVRQKNAGRRKNTASAALPKAPTGIQGLDEITLGGFPRGRPTLICGSAGAGKTLPDKPLFAHIKSRIATDRRHPYFVGELIVRLRTT